MGRPILVLFIVIVLAQLSPVSEAQGIWPMDKFDWLPSESAHEKYPMTLVKGTLLLKDGSSLYVPSKAIFNNGWGQIGSTHIVGRKMKSLPMKLLATWFSYTENEFFEGNFILPYDLILDLFRRGIKSPDTGKNVTYDRIIFGFGPEGAVSVWVATEGIVFEIGTFKGAEATVPWNAVIDNDAISRKDYIAGVLRHTLKPQHLLELEEYGMPAGISDIYSKRYTWILSIMGQKSETVWLTTLNGESEHVDLSPTSKTRTSRALPKSIDMYWETTAGKKCGAEISFDQSEVLAAYNKLSGGKNDHAMQLQLEISDDPRVIHTSLMDGKYIIKLNKTAVRAFSR